MPLTLRQLLDPTAPWFEPHVPSWLGPESSVLVYGAGGAGRDLARALGARGVTVAAFVDRSPKSESIEGVPVRRPAQLSPAELQLPTLIGVFNTGVDVGALESELARAGFTTVVPFPVAHRALYRELGDRYFLGAPSVLAACLDAAERARALFADEDSRRLFDAVLQFRLTGDASALPRANMTEQYFPRDVPLPRQPLAFVDAGAYVGDTLAWLGEHDFPVARAIAFEPDVENFARLAARVRSLAGRLGTVTLLPCGTLDTTRLVRFSADATAASRLDDSGDTTVLCVRLDDALSGFEPNFVKMDVEGAEQASLRGMSTVLAERALTLAISSYHTPRDHFEIPLLLAELVKEPQRGRFFLRSHGEQTFDTVVYFVPA